VLQPLSTIRWARLIVRCPVSKKDIHAQFERAACKKRSCRSAGPGGTPRCLLVKPLAGKSDRPWPVESRCVTRLLVGLGSHGHLPRQTSTMAGSLQLDRASCKSEPASFRSGPRRQAYLPVVVCFVAAFGIVRFVVVIQMGSVRSVKRTLPRLGAFVTRLQGAQNSGLENCRVSCGQSGFCMSVMIPPECR